MHQPKLQPDAQSGFNSLQKVIQSVFGTREFAVVVLVVACGLVEFAILAATQQYEAATAPPQAVIALGLSSAGMVVLFAELLKLPVAWVSGVVTGGKRVFFNVITFGLCVLTATTIKDLTTREWDLALAPARAAEARSRELLNEIESLERKKADLAQDAAAADRVWSERIAQTNSQLERTQAQKGAAIASHQDRVNQIKSQLLDVETQQKVKSLESARDVEAASFGAELKELQARFQSAENSARERQESADRDFERQLELAAEERKRIEEQSAAAEGRAQEEHKAATALYLDELKSYEQSRQEYEARRAEIERKLAEDLANLDNQDRIFFNLERKKADARAEANSQIARLESDFKARPVPVQPKRQPAATRPLPPLPTRLPPGGESVSPEVAEIQLAIDNRTHARDEARALWAVKINALYELSEAKSSSAVVAVQSQLDAANREFRETESSFNGQVSQLLDKRAEEEAQRRASQRSPAELERESSEITLKIPALKQEMEQQATEAQRLRRDTNAVRSASGVIRWLMPGSTALEQEEAAYGIYPVLIAMLVSFLPALLLELGVHSLGTPPLERRRAKWNLIRRFSRGRRALRIERGRAGSLAEEARSRLRELDQERAKLDKRVQELDLAVEERARGMHPELKLEIDALKALIRKRDAEVEKQSDALRSELAKADVMAIKQAEDIRTLAEAYVKFDSRGNSSVLELGKTLEGLIERLKERIDLASRNRSAGSASPVESGNGKA